MSHSLSACSIIGKTGAKSEPVFALVHTDIDFLDKNGRLKRDSPVIKNEEKLCDSGMEKIK